MWQTNCITILLYHCTFGSAEYVEMYGWAFRLENTPVARILIINQADTDAPLRQR